MTIEIGTAPETAHPAPVRRDEPARLERRPFTIPDVFNRPVGAEEAQRLIDYMCQRLGLANLDGLDVLDLGCGVRFADAIVNRDIPLKSYCGVDVYKEMIEFLAANCPDPRLCFVHLDVATVWSGDNGRPRLTADTVLPVDGRLFDVLCMFSVITHHVPAEAAALFTILRRHVRPDGRLFFSAYLERGSFGYREVYPDRPGALGAYRPQLLYDILKRTGWRVLSVENRRPGGLAIENPLVCAPC